MLKLIGSYYDFKNSKPFPYIVIDNILDSLFATKIQEEIINAPDDDWDIYNNPFEQKFTFRNKDKFPKKCAKLFTYLESDDFVNQLEQITGYKLITDKYKHYWGIHKYNDGDYLDIHVDAGIHPKNMLKKRITLGIYLSKIGLKKMEDI